MGFGKLESILDDDGMSNKAGGLRRDEEIQEEQKGITAKDEGLIDDSSHLPVLFQCYHNLQYNTCHESK
jgi:hypothetical protein